MESRAVQAYTDVPASIRGAGGTQVPVERRICGGFNLPELKLTEAQEVALNSKRIYGWRIFCVREGHRGRKQVILESSQHSFWDLKGDGSLIPFHKLRSDDF